MEEAKNMLRIGTYHAHIVNLQGVICEVEKEGHRLSNVSNIFQRSLSSVDKLNNQNLGILKYYL